MNCTEILYEKQDRVATVTLNRPAKLNAWTRVMEAEVRAALTSAAEDDEVRAIVITGAGRGFCAGADMEIVGGIAKGSRKAEAAEMPDSGDDDVLANYRQRFSYMLRLGKPVIAAINGPVAGIGLCMALFCDLRFMAEGAKLTTAFARRGLIAEHGISWMLPRLIGPMHALDLLLSARTIHAEEAARMGLVNLLPAEGFMETVRSRAKEIAHLSSPRSMGIIKQQVYDGLFQNLSQAWRIADEEMQKSFGSEDFAEGVASFGEKRPPHFSGR